MGRPIVMMESSSLIIELRGAIAEESARIAEDFAATGDGRGAVGQRTRLIEGILHRLWRDLVSADQHGPPGFALVATGGFGRGWLFPYSDIDPVSYTHLDVYKRQEYISTK